MKALIEKTVSQAQLKRNKQAKESITNRLSRLLLTFQDMYLGDYTNWKINKAKLELSRLKKENGSMRPEHEIDRLKRRYGKSYMDSDGIYDHKNAINQLEDKLSRIHILTLEIINEAKNGFDDKFNRLVDKVYEADLISNKLKVKWIDDLGGAFEFIISDGDREVHARIIYACGEVVAPHYRFITTLRMVKK